MDIPRILRSAIQQRMFPGAVVGTVDSKGVERIYCCGKSQYIEGEPLTACSIFDAASLTKVLPTSVLALMAIDQQACSLTTPVHTILPRFTGPHSRGVTVQHLLTHTVPYEIPLSKLKNRSAEEIFNTIVTTGFSRSPGRDYAYCNATSIVLGRVVEALWGQPLDVLGQTRLFSPLGMKDTTLHTPRSMGRVVPTEVDTWRGRVIRGEVHDESAWVLQDLLTPGSAGLFTTAPDILRFLQVLLHAPQQLFSEAMCDLIVQNYGEPLGKSIGLGFERNQPRYMGSYVSPGTVGKTGFTGCHFVADRTKGKGLVLLSNSTYPRRKYDARRIDRVRRAVTDSFFLKRFLL
ncbi:serine hydrolase domain-containing protein [Chitinivibrio alkaliphilus]|uniref:Beta-lactamase n=1 Tax=Chitinivibrio alkaliphilus ACht1 TaxID=1313304 RepID=U7D7J9_9BACT|nr:serine hydrolase domain-containing protein [Chitinivibrio alkaliphilus]ERP38930.1 beta-lactamase [Chitinivibrio alkaliphilus ACht1]